MLISLMRPIFSSYALSEEPNKWKCSGLCNKDYIFLWKMVGWKNVWNKIQCIPTQDTLSYLRRLCILLWRQFRVGPNVFKALLSVNDFLILFVFLMCGFIGSGLPDFICDVWPDFSESKVSNLVCGVSCAY